MSSKRVNVTVEEELYKDLEEWADQQKRPIASLAAYLLHQAVRNAKESGVFEPKALSLEEATNLYIKAFLERSEVADCTLELVSEATGVEVDRLREALKTYILADS